VDLPAFYIGRYEVTVGQYRAFVEATGHSVDPQALQGAPDHPASFVSWPDALAYARWLERQIAEGAAAPENLRRLLAEGWTITLPSEAEWEKAARGTDARIFPWGNEPRRDRANFGTLSAAPVGSIACPECAHGLADMSGNVWEYTRSPYQPYPYDESDDAADLETDALWVMRGGSFGDSEQNVRAAIRGGADPGVRRDFIGFRLAITRY
jgi:formylglycine-generating enzyme required for sulfatase activity